MLIQVRCDPSIWRAWVGIGGIRNRDPSLSMVWWKVACTVIRQIVAFAEYTSEMMMVVGAFVSLDANSSAVSSSLLVPDMSHRMALSIVVGC
jgi:hypothetical protein